MPRVLGYIILDDPFFELSETLLLLFTKVSDVPRCRWNILFFLAKHFQISIYNY